MRTINTDTATTLELIAFYNEPVSDEEASSPEWGDLLDEVELELIRRDDVPEEHLPLIDELQEDWVDDL